MAYADLTGDHTPVHTDEAYARTTPFGTRVAHGLFGLSVADGLKTKSDMRFLPGMSLGWEWGFVGADQARRHGAREVPRRQQARIEEQARLGHRRAAVRADQPARRGRAEGRAPRDGAEAPAHEHVASQQALPLAGIRVIDYSHFLAGPHMSRCLAALGAEVIKVERPASGRRRPRQHAWFVDGQSGYFLQQNMGKQGPVRQPEGPARPGADAQADRQRRRVRRELPPRRARQARPRLRGTVEAQPAGSCTARSRPMATPAPTSQRAGFGLIAEAKSGAMRWSASPGEPPPLFRMPIADMYAGMHGVAAICAALLGRVTSPAAASTSTSRCTTAWCRCTTTRCSATRCAAAQEVPVQTGHDLPQSTVYGVFRGARRLPRDRRAGRRCVEALRRADRRRGLRRPTRAFTAAAGRNAHRAEILAKVRDVDDGAAVGQGLLRRARRGRRAGAPRCRRIDEVLADPQIRGARHDRRAGPSAAGQDPAAEPAVPLLRLRHLDHAGRRRCSGQHNREIAASLGYRRRRSTRWRRRRAVRRGRVALAATLKEDTP